MSRTSFGEFELDLDTGELRRGGEPVALQAQAARLLVALAEKAGRLVTRKELIERLWPDRYVDFDQGLHNTVRQLRAALSDDPRKPRFVETVPRQGYRFVARVSTPRSSPRAALRPGRHSVWVAAAAVAVLAIGSWWLSRASTARQPTAIVVLPFSGGGTGSSEAAALGDALAEELTRELVAVAPSPVRVVGHVSARRALRESADERSAANRLSASHLVQGVVRSELDRLQLDLALVRVSDGEVLFEESRRSSWSGLLTARDELAREIAHRIGLQLSPTVARARRAPRLRRQSLEKYLEARYLLAKRGPEAARSAADRLREVVREAPGFAPARIALGEALLAGGPVDVAEVREVAEGALTLAPESAGAHLLRARVALGYEWDWATSERHLRRALELAPGDPMVHLVRAFHAASLGRHSEALEAGEAARELDPLSAVVQGDLTFLRFWARDWQGVLRESDRLLALEPEDRLTRGMRLEALLRAERWEEGRAEVLALCADAGGLENVAGPDLRTRFLEIQRERWLDAEPGPLRSMVLASIAAQLGEDSPALEHLADAIERSSSYVPFVAVDPHFDGLSSRPEFQQLLRAAGHPLASAEGTLRLAAGR